MLLLSCYTFGHQSFTDRQQSQTEGQLGEYWWIQNNLGSTILRLFCCAATFLIVRLIKCSHFDHLHWISKFGFLFRFYFAVSIAAYFVLMHALFFVYSAILCWILQSIEWQNIYTQSLTCCSMGHVSVSLFGLRVVFWLRNLKITFEFIAKTLTFGAKPDILA